MGSSDAVDLAAPGEARARLARCCGSTRWIDRMLARRPFGGIEPLVLAAREVWFALDEPDWREAFTHHPKIGDRAALEARFAATHDLSASEQSGVNAASAGVLDALAAANSAYEARFGYIFIVCATGKNAAEMLELLRERLSNTADEEIRIAAGEQAKITEIRLRRL